MPNTYTKIVFHIVFAVKYRQALIAPEMKDELERYITGLFTHRNQKMLIISCMPDHVHMLISYRPVTVLSDLVKEVKVASTNFIKSRFPTCSNFNWQSGYGCFSCNPYDLDGIFNYIRNQEQHHAKKKFKDEYKELLINNRVDFDEKYFLTDPE